MELWGIVLVGRYVALIHDGGMMDMSPDISGGSFLRDD